MRMSNTLLSKRQKERIKEPGDGRREKKDRTSRSRRQSVAGRAFREWAGPLRSLEPGSQRQVLGQRAPTTRLQRESPGALPMPRGPEMANTFPAFPRGKQDRHLQLWMGSLPLVTEFLVLTGLKA